MDDRSNLVGVIVLGALAAGALAVMGVCAARGEQIPSGVAAAFGTAVGALAGLLSPWNGGGR